MGGGTAGPGTLAVTTEQRRAVESELRATIKNITNNIFRLHGIQAGSDQGGDDARPRFWLNSRPFTTTSNKKENYHDNPTKTVSTSFADAGNPDVSTQPGSDQTRYINAEQYKQMYGSSINGA